jgi:hypothetical protein
MTNRERNQLEHELRTNLQARGADLAQLWQEMNGHWAFEDGIYRFYHQSYKVFRLQDHTTRIVETLQSLLPGQPLNPWFLLIVNDGTGKVFEMDVNSRWHEVTRPIVEAFFHARFFLELANRYQHAPNEQPMSSGWAAFLYLFNLR